MSTGLENLTPMILVILKDALRPIVVRIEQGITTDRCQDANSDTLGASTPWRQAMRLGGISKQRMCDGRTRTLSSAHNQALGNNRQPLPLAGCCPMPDGPDGAAWPRGHGRRDSSRFTNSGP